MAPFLTVLTRTYKRPTLVAENIKSLSYQSDLDFEHVFLRDTVGRGVAWANARMRDAGPLVHGQYVMVLDDDDMIIYPTLVTDLKRLAAQRPDVIMTRMDHGERGVLPAPEDWGTLPPRGKVGCSAAIIRAELWCACAPSWGEAYDGDYDFLREVFARAEAVVWHDEIVSAVQVISLGRPEHA